MSRRLLRCAINHDRHLQHYPATLFDRDWANGHSSRALWAGRNPQAVFDELRDPKTPQMVKDWFASRLAWLEVKTLSQPPDISLGSLDYGEREAIALALELNADAVLIDDKDARVAAKARALVVLPTLALLELAAQKSLLDLPDAIDRLSKTTFRAKPELFEQALERDRQRKQAEESNREEDH